MKKLLMNYQLLLIENLQKVIYLMKIIIYLRTSKQITNHGRGESVLINIEDYAKYEEFLHQRYVAEALTKAKQQAADPSTQWADHESVWETLHEQYDV